MTEDESPPKPDDKPDPEARYFELGAKFLADCYVLLGYHVTESHQTVGELEPAVKLALNNLALATIDRMTRIMGNDLGVEL